MIPVLPFSFSSPLGWAPWREMQRLQAEIDQLVSSTATFGGDDGAPMHVWSDEGGLHIELELPGVAPEQIQLSVENQVLKLEVQAASESAEPSGDERRWLKRERSSNAFTRSLRLPYPIDAERVSARCEHGLLAIDLPRPQRDAARRIAVSSGAVANGANEAPAS